MFYSCTNVATVGLILHSNNFLNLTDSSIILFSLVSLLTVIIQVAWML